MIWRLLTLLPYAAAFVACLVFGVRRSQRIAEAKRLADERAMRPRTSYPVVFRPFSVYINAYKWGVFSGSNKLATATGHDLRLGAEETRLTVRQLVTNTDRYPGERMIRDAFVDSGDVDVVVDPIDGDSMPLGKMRVLSVHYSTDYKTGVTSLTAELSGPSLSKASKDEAERMSAAWSAEQERRTEPSASAPS